VLSYFTKYHQSTVYFPAKCKTQYFFKIVSTSGTLLLLEVLNIGNTGHTKNNGTGTFFSYRKLEKIFFFL